MLDDDQEGMNMVKINGKDDMEGRCDRKRKEKCLSSRYFSSPYLHSHQSNKFYSCSSFHQLKRRSTISSLKSKSKNELNDQLIDIINENNSTTTQIKLSLPIVSNNPKYFIQNKEEEFTLPTNPPITVTIQPQKYYSNQNFNCKKENLFHDDHLTPPHLINQQSVSFDSSSKNSSTIVNYLMDLLKPSDNKLAMKLFGSRKGVLKERLRQQRAGHCIIHPCSNFR